MNNPARKKASRAHFCVSLIRRRLALVFLGPVLTVACDALFAWDGSLEALMKSQPAHFSTVLENPAKHRVQIIYTQIDRDAENHPSFRSFTYRLDADEYFYPASTVKLPVAVFALEKLNELAIKGLNRDTTMLVADEESGKSVGRYVREILLVSDNVAFNRLYDFLGQEAINNRMMQAGFDGTRIMHRLQIALSVEENRRTGPVRFSDDRAIIYEQEAASSRVNYTAPDPILLGKAEIINGDLIEQPKDFANKNAFPLQAQHDFIKALVFPESVDEHKRFRLSDDDYDFVYRNMSGYPGDSGIEEYADADRYPDGYVKFLMFGGDEAGIPPNIRIFNKVGDAYGFLTDAAYIVDFENGVEFILAATIFTNANQTFNDDTYEYNEVGFPFMRHLGQAIYDMERQRERRYLPDFESIRVRNPDAPR